MGLRDRNSDYRMGDHDVITILHFLFIIAMLCFLVFVFAIAVLAGTTVSEAQQHSFVGQLLGWLVGISVIYGLIFLFNEIIYEPHVWPFFARHGILI